MLEIFKTNPNLLSTLLRAYSRTTRSGLLYFHYSSGCTTCCRITTTVFPIFISAYTRFAYCLIRRNSLWCHTNFMQIESFLFYASIIPSETVIEFPFIYVSAYMCCIITILFLPVKCILCNAENGVDFGFIAK